jgi:hypothetical protein
MVVTRMMANYKLPAKVQKHWGKVTVGEVIHKETYDIIAA